MMMMVMHVKIKLSCSFRTVVQAGCRERKFLNDRMWVDIAGGEEEGR